MTKMTRPEVTVLGWTHFDAAAAAKVGDDWSTDAEGGEALAEFAGRACYQSWTKPNPATATNAGYLAHIKEVAHFSVLEHGVVTIYYRGVSRSFTHELVRHRHFSYSQLSQRYVSGDDTAMVEPDIIADHPGLHDIFSRAADDALDAYEELRMELEAVMADRDDLTATQRKKAARQAARAILPNAAETRIVVTGNFRAWRHFIDLRATEHADVEIRAVAIETLRKLQTVAPNVFGDYVITELPDGTEVAESNFREES